MNQAKSFDYDQVEVVKSRSYRPQQTNQPKRFLKLISTYLNDSVSKISRRTFEIPHIVAKRLQKYSLSRNEAVSVDTEIPSTSKGLTSHPEPEPETTKKMKNDDCQSEDAENDYSRVTPGDKLCEDELTLIFSNSWISAQDLLNFRLVSKRWRDAATTTLRRRDACVVELWAELDFDPLFFRQSIGKFMDKDKLSQFTDLISMSPKFPATDFRIHISLLSITSFTLFPNLLHFFQLHGDKIKTLRLHGILTARCLLEILQIHAPNLEGLHLSKAVMLELDGEDGSEGNSSKWTSKAVSLKSFDLGRFGYLGRQNKTEFLRLLLSSLPKLGSIENVTLQTLQMVLTEGKGHLIRSFKYLLQDEYWVPASQLTKFVSLYPKPQLSKVTLDLENRWPSAAATIINSLNEFIESFKDTVHKLELFCLYYQRAWDPLLNIPPMKNLKSFTLKLETRCGVIGGDHLVPDCRMCQAEESKIFIDVRGTLFQFQDGISAHNYFPSLMDVHLHSNLSKFNQVSPMSFFSFKSDTDNADGSSAKSGFFPEVDVLEINQMDVWSRPRPAGTCHSPTETSLVAEVFPNIRILKFKCGKLSNLSSDLWALCPNVEFAEICGIESFSSSGREVEMSHFVDKVFTGSSDRLLRRLRRSAAEHPSEADDLEDFKFKPRLSDLRRLRELKLKFVGKWSSNFASFVTGLYAFSKMPNTKFILSYDPEMSACGLNGEKDVASRNEIVENINEANGSVKTEDDRIAEYEELIFGPLKPYVHIVHERR